MRIELTGGNVNRGHFYIERGSSLLPADSWGGKNASERARPVIFDFAGTGESVETDIAGDKRIPRNARGQCNRFFSHYGLKAGDYIEVRRTGPRRFLVSAIESTATTPVPANTVPAGNATPGHAESVVQRIIRDTKVGRYVKNLYGYKCQVCNVAIQTNGGPYAEGAHIRPLGPPHNGPDVTNNILCLCPNHHVMLDGGTLTINDDLTLNGAEGQLKVRPSHRLGVEHLRYQRDYAQQVAAADRPPATRAVGG